MEVAPTQLFHLSSASTKGVSLRVRRIRRGRRFCVLEAEGNLKSSVPVEEFSNHSTAAAEGEILEVVVAGFGNSIRKVKKKRKKTSS